MEKADLQSRLTLVVPAKNEERTIADVVIAGRNYVSEVLVVDGHSTDKTALVAKENGARVISDNGRGKGDALRCALQSVYTEYLVFCDADGSHEISHIPKLLEELERENYDIVVASRLKGGSSELHGGFSEFFRLCGSSFATTCINKRFGTRLSDSQNGFRAARLDKLNSLELRSNGTTIEQEMLMKALKKGYRIGEIASHEYSRKYGESHISIRKVWYLYLWNLMFNLI
jgi:dolichol-phosphate mannosyltransferase